MLFDAVKARSEIVGPVHTNNYNTYCGHSSQMYDIFTKFARFSTY